MEEILEEIKQKIAENLEDLSFAQERFGGVWVSQNEQSNGFFLELETAEDTVLFSLEIELGALQSNSPKQFYDLLVDELESEGVDVFDDESSWVEALERG